MKKNSESKYVQLTQEPIKKLIPRLAIPSMIAMLITSVYNVADTFFVSQLSQSASGAVGIVYSLMAIIQTLGFTVSMGCSINVSNALGNKENKYASNIFCTGFFTMCIVGAVVTIVGLLFLEPLMYLLGSTATILPYAKNYGIFILLAAPFMTSSYVMNACLRSQGNAFLSMVALATGGILNIILNPLLMFGFNLGITGAGLATAISQIISFSILFYQCNFNDHAMSIKFSDFKPCIQIYKKILVTGFPNFCRQGLSSVASIVLNVLANPYGDAAIAAISIVSRVLMFISSAFIGFGQGFQTVTGYNYGAKKYDRVLEAFWFAIKVGIICMSCIGFICFIFSYQIINIFREGDLEVIAIGVFMLKLNCISIPLQSITTICNMCSQSIGYSVRASFLAMARQGIFFLPLLFIFTSQFGLLGIQIAQPAADVFAVIFSIFIIRTVIRDLNNLKNSHCK